MCVIVFVLVAAALAVVAWAGAVFFGGWAGEAGWAIVVMAMLLVPVVVLLVHEAGHVLGGVLTGMSPVMMIVGPVGLYRKCGEIRPRLRLNALVPGGFTLCLPSSPHAVSSRMAIMTAGGPAASLLFAVTAAIIALSAEGNLCNAALFTAVLSVGLFLITAIPYYRGGMASDGAKILTLTSGGSSTTAFSAGLHLLYLAYRGRRPAHWPQNVLDVALRADKGTPERASGLHLAYWSALDKGDIGSARDLLSELQAETESMAEAVAGPVAFEAAAFLVFEEGRPAAARARIEGRGTPVLQERYLAPLVRAGLACASGNSTAARDWTRRTRAALPKALFPAIAALHARWLDQLESRPGRGVECRSPRNTSMD